MRAELTGNNALYRNVVLTIITVVKNDEVRLFKTIKSLVMIYGDNRFEHIIVDCLSTDGTADLLNKISSISNVKVISDSDYGIYDAMNKGLNLSSGSYELFLNCGDELLAKPEQIVKWCNEINPALVDIACFSCVAEFGNRQLLLNPKRHSRYKMPTSHQAMIFTRNFLTEHNYNIEYTIAGDFELYLQSSSDRVFIVFDRKPLTLIQGEGFASNNPFIAYKEYLTIVFNKYQGFLCFFAVILIFCKFISVFIIKKILPKRCINYLRSVM